MAGGRIHELTVVGLGNTIMGDDAVGIHVWERLRSKHGARAHFVYGGVAGLELVPEVTDAHRLLVCDAVAAGPGRNHPGDIVVASDADIPQMMRSPVSPHQLGLMDLLGAARLVGREPERVVLVGVVVDEVTLRIGMTAPVRDALDAAVARAEAELMALLNESSRERHR